jgi:pimeloyl-[acyl-carrier protein] synthase
METLGIDLKNPLFLENPYPFYAQMRENTPVFWLPTTSPLGGMWLLTRYSDVAAALSDDRLTKDVNYVIPADTAEPRNRDLLNLDPPDHTRLRGLVNQVFTPKKVKDLEPGILSIIESLLERPKENRQMDFIAEFALPLPIFVIAEMLGVPAGDRGEFHTWTNAIITSIDAVNQSEESQKQGQEAGLKLLEYISGLIKERRQHPREDLISDLVQVRDGGDRMSESELIGMCQLLLIAGHETTVNLLGNGLYSLLSHPSQFELLKDQPELMGSAIEEMLRFETPVQRGTSRFTKEPMAYAGETIPAGSQVSGVIGSANRDPQQFPDPDRFDITRSPNRHLAFGRGIHFCLGAPLARTEARLAFKRLLEEFPLMELMEERPNWNGNSWMRGLRTLPIKC